MKVTVHALFLSFLVATGAPAAPSGGQEPDVPAHFEPFVPLVGGTWRGSFPGGELFDLQEFEWMLGGRFLRNVHRVTRSDGEVVYEGETVYGWDHATERVRWWYFNSTGGHVVGDFSVEEGRLVAEGENTGPEGQTARVRSELVVGEESWTSTSYSLQDGEWKERFTMEFVREDEDTE